MIIQTDIVIIEEMSNLNTNKYIELLNDGVSNIIKNGVLKNGTI